MNSKIQRIPYIYTFLLVTIYVGTVTGLSRITTFEALKFLAFHFFGVFLCGYTLVLICKIKLHSTIQLIGLSYATGYVLQIVNYFLFASFGLQKHVIFLIAVEVVMSGFYLWKKSASTSGVVYTSKENIILFGIILIVVFVYKFILGFGSLYISSDVLINPVGQSKDFYYHCQNTVAAKIGFPLMDMRDLGEVYYYHYFSSLFDAVESFATGISVVNLEAHLDQVQGALLLAFGTFSVVESVCSNIAVRCWACFALLFSIGNDAATGVSLPGKLYINPFGCDIGIGLAFILLFLVLDQINDANSESNSRIHWGSVFLVGVFTFAATGAKGPCALITIFGFGLVLIIEFFKKNYKIALANGLTVLITFGLTYIFLVAERSTGVQADSVLSGWLDFGLSSIKPYYVWSFYGKLTGFGIPGFIASAFCVVLWMFEAKPAIFLATIVAVIVSIFFKIKPNKYVISGFSAYLLANILGLLISQDGSSQMYFVIMGVLLAGVACGDVFDRMLTMVDTKMIKAAYGRCIYIFLVGSILVGFKYLDVTSQNTILKENIAKITSKGNVEPSFEVQSSVRIAEIEVYDWIRNNTDMNDMLISDIYLMDNQEGNFIASAMSERRLWQDGWTYSRLPDQVVRIKEKLKVLKQCYNGNTDAMERIKGDGVKYMIHMKALGENEDIKGLGTSIYENSSAIVYKIN